MIEINIDRHRRKKDIQDICGLLSVSNVLMTASDDVMAESNDVLEASDGKNSNVP